MKTRDEVIALFRNKYAYLKTVYPSVGPFEEIRLYQNPNGGWQMDLENCAAITLRPNDEEAHETHGPICARWYGEEGAFNEKGAHGKLGYPISDELVGTDPPQSFISNFSVDSSERQSDDIEQLQLAAQISHSPAGRINYTVIRKWRYSKFERGIIRWRDLPSDNGHIEVEVH